MKNTGNFQRRKTLLPLTRILVFICALLLIAVLFTPIWRIELTAPQYPEGLGLSIHADGLRGNVDIINGLNHYIGMKELHNEDFFEFTILPYIIVFFAVFCVIVALFNRKGLLQILFIAFVAFGIIAMIDFWRWEYDYGHNLNPNAAIVVPGMAYQPPLIGFKQLLNFGAYSIPDTGGWLFILTGAVLMGCLFLEWRSSRSLKKKTIASPAIAIVSLLFLSSCSAGPDPVVAGKDNCHLCKMTITDIRYAAEAVSEKGKAFKFDDIHCLNSFVKSNGKESKMTYYFSDFAGEHSLVKSDNAFFMSGEGVKAPMNGNIIAFSSKDSLFKYSSLLGGKEISLSDLLK